MTIPISDCSTLHIAAEGTAVAHTTVPKAEQTPVAFVPARISTCFASSHTESSRYLAEHGISVALEFRDLPLPLIERTWHKIMGRDPNATPGAVVLALRTLVATRTAMPSTATTEGEGATGATAALHLASAYTSQRSDDDSHDLCRDTTATETLLYDTVDVPLVEEPHITHTVSPRTERLNQLWQDVIRTLQARLPRPEFDTWLGNTILLKLRDGVATVQASSFFQKEGLENRYTAPIRRALCECLGTPVQLCVVSPGIDD
ncbi:MAG: hypothetical protein HGA19_01280 [Oscillochloris sp.]|nr:hypothetical protein [Oscillochloris sp.]